MHPAGVAGATTLPPQDTQRKEPAQAIATSEKEARLSDVLHYQVNDLGHRNSPPADQRYRCGRATAAMNSPARSRIIEPGSGTAAPAAEPASESPKAPAHRA